MAEVEMGNPSSAQRQAQRLNELHDAEESGSLLAANGQNNSGASHHSRSQRSLDELDRLTTTTSNNNTISNDLRVCNTAWNKLSCFTKFIVLFVTCTLLLYGTYQFAVDEGVREQVRENADTVATNIKWKVFGNNNGGSGGDDERDKKSKNINGGDGSGGVSSKNSQIEEEGASSSLSTQTQHPTTQTLFTKETLINTRKAAETLITSLDEYYGGKDIANSMLVHSWQAQWMLEGDFVLLDGNNESNEDENDDDDDDSVDDDDDDDSVDDDDDSVDDDTANSDKNNNNSGKPNDRHLDNKREKRKKKNKGAKEGKVIINIDQMSPEELTTHHHRRRQRTTKLVETMARAVLNPHQTTFKIGTIGSSVAAGHDNCYYDTYENQLQRTLTPLFNAVNNMSIIVQNAGEGGGCGDNHQNQVYCITHNVSPDVDIIHYSWTYFEKETPEIQREQLIRWGQTMERKPMVHHLVARGKSNTCDGDSQSNVDLDKQYAMYGYNAFCIQTGLYGGGYDYDAEIEEGINRFGWKHQGDGYHNTTRYGEELDDDNPRKASLGVVYRNWHPGPLGFQISSDAFAYVYTMGLIKALDVIEQDMNAGINVLDRWFEDDHHDRRRLGNSRQLLRTSHWSELPEEPRRLHLPPTLDNMPEPLFCDPVYCSTPHPPYCLNYELPTFGTPGIAVKSQSEWTISHDDNKWNHEVGKVDIAWIKALHDPEWEKKCTHADACGGISAEDSTQGILTYELPSSKMTAGLVFICGCCGKNVGNDMFIENESVVFKLNGRVLDKSLMDVYPNHKCVRLLRWFGGIDDYTKEDVMLLTVEMTDNEEVTPVTISHVVAL